jgi:hypothetical protein
MWPVKGKGLTIKIREAGDLADVLADVAGRLGQGRGPARLALPPPPPQGRGSAPPPFDATGFDDRPQSPDFDEFN